MYHENQGNSEAGRERERPRNSPLLACRRGKLQESMQLLHYALDQLHLERPVAQGTCPVDGAAGHREGVLQS